MDSRKNEFVRLLAILGWSQAEAARQLRQHRTTITRWCNPDDANQPSFPTIQLLKIMVAREKPGAIDLGSMEINPEALTGEERGLVDTLRRAAPEKQKDAYRVLEAILGPLKRSLNQSEVHQIVTRTVDGAAALMHDGATGAGAAATGAKRSSAQYGSARPKTAVSAKRKARS